MIPRVLEPEVMNDPLQVEAYAAADFNASDQAVVDRIEQLLDLDDVHFRHQACLVDLGFVRATVCGWPSAGRTVVFWGGCR